ncbi:MAG: hypothetical protein M1822_002983 [Bathelium mastoideum]|nr:MAG: hypothetical protein M1822_002983 [Bathelium mastoideum]
MSQASPQQQSDAPDSRNSLRHILAAEPEEEGQRTQETDKTTPQDEGAQEGDDGARTEREARSPSPGKAPHYTSTTQTTRRNANGSVSSVYSGNKIRQLKKEDGVPLWRKDIQFDFLRAVFEDTTPVFTRFSDGTKGHNFADVYLDAMAKSSKCSKILKDKLLTERPSALNMAMVCLLVNVGRMNTTLNFFPEMRAQLRTYHSIPALQAHQDPNAYKQLQDAPRLKSILKGATEDTEQPSTIEDIRAAKVPRTNPVNLIFVLSQYAPKISELHFHPPRDFYDLVMRSALSSKSRANAFLWLMWWYLESDFSKEDALNNPFGPGQDSEGPDGIPLKVPQFEYLTEEQANLENVDTQSEIDFGEHKKQERVAILATDPPSVSLGPRKGPKKGYNASSVFGLSDDGSPARDTGTPQPGSFTSVNLRGSKHHSLHDTSFPSDSERTRSPSPVSHSNQPQIIPTSGMNINTLLNEDAPSPAPRSRPAKPPGPGRGNWRRNKNKDAAAASANTPGSNADRPYKPRTIDSNHSTGSHLTTHLAYRGEEAASGSFNSLWNPIDPYSSNPYAHPSQPALHPGAAGTPLATLTPHAGAGPVSPTQHPGYFNQPALPPNHPQNHAASSFPRAPPPFIPTASLGLPSNAATSTGANAGGTSGRGSRARPQTQHQLRVEQHRQQHVNYLLDRQLRTVYTRRGRQRRREGTMLRAWRRLAAIGGGGTSTSTSSTQHLGRHGANGSGEGGAAALFAAGYDSAEEEVVAAGGKMVAGGTVVGPGGAPVRGVEQALVRMSGVGGLVPGLAGLPAAATGEREDWGEEADAWGRVMRRFARRMERWEGPDPRSGVRKGRSGLRRGEKGAGDGDDEKRDGEGDGEERRREEGYSSPFGGAGDGDEGEGEKERRLREGERMDEGEDEEDEGDEDEDREMDDVGGEDTESDGEMDDEKGGMDSWMDMEA